MNKRLFYVLKDAVECRCRPNIDDIDAQNILFYIEENEQLRAKVAELEAQLKKYQNLEPVAWCIKFRTESHPDFLTMHYHGTNAIADYRAIDPDAICEPLYALEK